MTDLSVVVFSFARNYIDYVKLPMGAKKKKCNEYEWMNTVVSMDQSWLLE